MPTVQVFKLTTYIRTVYGGSNGNIKKYVLDKTIAVVSQSNVNVVYCYCKEITSNYNVITEIVITERNMSHSLPNVGIIFKLFINF